MMLKKEKFNRIMDLFLISFIALYFEILFIRWIPSSIQIMAYFANIILISCFLGLWLGCLLTKISFDLMKLFPVLMFIDIVLFMGLSYTPIEAGLIRGEHLLGGYQVQGVHFLVVIGIIFSLNTLLFVVLGQKLGACLRYFKPLVAYSINIAGSITGVIAFTYLAYFMVSPFYWFLFGFTAALWFYISSRKEMLFKGLIMALTLFVIIGINIKSYWSPYYKIDISPYISGNSHKALGLFISANNTHHQYAFNLTEKSVASLPELKHYKEIYEFPYKFIRPRNVLILGAGSGNDAAAALRMGVKDISVVEIDPFIAGMGKWAHGEKPYASKNARLFIDDARSFIKKTDRKFDLITFGYLDAHRVLSQFSSVRMDNFIYTKESFQDIKNHLSQDGLLSLTYLVFREWIGSKLYSAMKDTFGDSLKVIRTSTYNKDDTVIFLAGPATKNITFSNIPNFKLYDGFDKYAQSITDDWPYLYLMKKGIPLHYILVLCLVSTISLLSIVYIGSGTFKKFNAHFFFLGVGFMLLETVGITRFALLFGSTWIVNSVVIISILSMILLANLYAVSNKKININLVYILLISSILLNWLLKPDLYLTFHRALGIVLSSLVLSLPLLFASIIFAVSLRDVKDISAIFAYNLIGAVAGGFCEYISMISGFNFLFIFAIAVYYLSYVGMVAENKKKVEIIS